MTSASHRFVNRIRDLMATAMETTVASGPSDLDAAMNLLNIKLSAEGIKLTGQNEPAVRAQLCRFWISEIAGSDRKAISRNRDLFVRSQEIERELRAACDVLVASRGPKTVLLIAEATKRAQRADEALLTALLIKEEPTP